jgi:uncharacterized membrane protein
MNRLAIAAVLLLVAAACRPAPSASPAGEQAPTQPRAFVGKTWLSTDPAAAQGTIRIFLADGTLVMDSCFETYRLARWEALDEKRIAWQEDTARIEAEVDESAPGRLRLRLKLAQEIKDESYSVAPTPFVCPDVQALRFTVVSARGNEPFWGLEVDGDAAIVRTPEELAGVSYGNGVWRTNGPRRWSYRADRKGTGQATDEIALELEETPCADTMSDERFPLRAVFTRNGRRMEGCALEGRRRELQ